MFDNNNKIFAYKIALKLDPYLLGLFHLCYDVFLKLENITEQSDGILHATKLFKKEFYESLDIVVEDYLEQDENGKYTSSKEVFFSSIASNLNKTYLTNENFLSKLHKEHLYYFKDSATIYSTIDKSRELANNLNEKFKTVNLIPELLSNLENQNLIDSIKSISTIYNLNKAGQYITVKNDNFLKPHLYFIDAVLLDPQLIKEEIFDFDKVWINYKHLFSKELKFNDKVDEYYLVSSAESGNVIGLRVNEKILLKYDVDIASFIMQESRNSFLWEFFKENLFRQKKPANIPGSQLIEDFKKNSNDIEFNQLLCNLKHNLYFDKSVTIKDDYSKYFEEFFIVRELDELSNFNMFLPDENIDKDLLAIYAKEKIGEKYNLLHHLKHLDGKSYLSNVNSTPQKKDKEKVNILKVELSFYFVEKYYEDIIEGLLKELGCKDYLSNVELCIDGVSKAEFDFVIYSKNKFYFIEAKTTLSKNNVYDTSKKYNTNIQYLKKVIKDDLNDFRFLLLGLLSNANLDNYKHFFRFDEPDYNFDREGFSVIPYKFKVPFFNHQNLELECISEPEILKLKEYIKETCQI